MTNLKDYNKNEYIIKNNNIIIELEDNKKIILNETNNYLNILNNFITKINNNYTNYNNTSIKHNNNLYYDYFKFNNGQEEINKNNLTNYIINCIIFYVYNFEKDKINKLNEIIYNNFTLKIIKTYDTSITYTKIYLKNKLFIELYYLNLNIKIDFINKCFINDINDYNIFSSNLILFSSNTNLYYKSFYNDLIYYYNNLKLLNEFKIFKYSITFYNNIINNIDENDEIEYKRNCIIYLKLKQSQIINNLKDKLLFTQNKYNINSNEYAYSKGINKILIKDDNNNIIKDDNNNYIFIRRKILYIKLDKNIKELNLYKNNFLGIINEFAFSYIDNKKFKNKNNYYLITYNKIYKKYWFIINLIDNNNQIYNHSLTISKFLNYYNIS